MFKLCNCDKRIVVFLIWYACPTAFGINKESAELFGKNLKGPAGNFELIYTKSESGRKTLKECKKMSRITEIK